MLEEGAEGIRETHEHLQKQIKMIDISYWKLLKAIEIQAFHWLWDLLSGQVAQGKTRTPVETISQSLIIVTDEKKLLNE